MPLDFELWRSPAPRTPFRDNIPHYNRRRFRRRGNGELGNDGVPMLDLRRRGMRVDHPSRVVSQGGRYCFDDDQETLDIHIASFEFGPGKLISWEGLGCGPFRLLRRLGNIAHRTGRSLARDPKDGRILGDPEAMALRTKEYAPGWEPPR